jgi:hypothetical protein
MQREDKNQAKSIKIKKKKDKKKADKRTKKVNPKSMTE